MHQAKGVEVVGMVVGEECLLEEALVGVEAMECPYQKKEVEAAVEL